VDYAELEIGLYRQDAASYRIELRFSQPDDRADRPETSGVARFDLEALRQQQLDPDEYGRQLGVSLLADPAIRAEFDTVWAVTQASSKGLRLRLFIDTSAAELHDLRWETLRLPQDGSWVLSNEQLLFSRYLRSQDWTPVRLRPRGNLRALVAIANPAVLGADPTRPYTVASEAGGRRALAPIDVAGELARAQAGLGALLQGQLVSDPGTGSRVSLDNLVTKLREGYDILYLVCHGALDQEARQGQREPLLWLETDDGAAAIVPGRELVGRLRDLAPARRPRLVVLASCQSAGQGVEPQTVDEGALAALGPRLAIEAGVPAVLAMQGNVTMKTVAELMPAFFGHLSEHGRVDQALAVARGLVHERPDRWMPVLFLRLRDGQIWYNPGFVGDQEVVERLPALCTSIRRGKLTPIIGPGLLNPLLGTRQELAQRWPEADAFPLLAHHRTELPHVAQYLAATQSPDYMRESYERLLKTELQRAYQQQTAEPLQNHERLEALFAKVAKWYHQRPELDAYEILARLPFSLYITTNTDTLMSEALTAAGRAPVVEVLRWNSSLSDWPSIYQSERDYRPSVQRPLVYHLFGHCSRPDSLVLTEDDYFDYLMWVNRTEAIPTVIDAAWTTNVLLFLGFELDDWGFRVLFRSILNEERRARPRKPPSVTVQMSPTEIYRDPDRARHYLEQYFETLDLYWGSIEDFLQALWQQWEREGGQL
jgi:hypothetical protein